MTSTNSLNNLRVALKYVYRKNKISAIVSAVLSLVTAFLAMVTISSSLSFMGEIDGTVISKTNITTNVITGMGSALFMFSVVYNFFSQMELFKTFYSKRASDLTLAFPIKREFMFLGNWIFTQINTVVSALFIGAWSVLYTNNSIVSKVLTFDTAIFLKAFIAIVFLTLAVNSFLTMIAATVGTKWQYFVIGAPCFGVVIGILNNIGEFINRAIVGFEYKFEKIFSPISFKYALLQLLSSTHSVRYRYIIIGMIFLNALCAVLGIILFKKRKSESAEQRISSNIFVASLIALVSLSMYIVSFRLFGYNYVAVAIGVVVFVATSIIMSLIFARKFVFKKGLKVLIPTVVIASVASVALFATANNYSTDFPNASDVKKTTIIFGTNYDSVASFDFFSVLGASEWQENYEFNFNEEITIKTVMELEKFAIKKETKALSINHFSRNNIGLDDEKYNYTYFVYEMKDGTKIVRKYRHSYDQLSAFYKIMATAEYKSQSEIMNISDDDFFCVGALVYDNNYNTYYDSSLDFLHSIKNDFASNDYISEIEEAQKYEEGKYDFTDEKSDFEDGYYENSFDSDVTIYYFNDLANDATREKLKNMPDDELENLVWSRTFTDDNSPISSVSFSVQKLDSETGKLLVEKGYYTQD